MFFSIAFRHRFWIVFWKAGPLKINENHWFFNGFAKFSQNRGFQKNRKKSTILVPFWDAQAIQIRQKNVFETDAFFNIVFFCVFLYFFAIWDRFWEAQGGQKF